MEQVHIHAHHEAHHHGHHGHAHAIDWKNVNNAFIVGMVLNFLFVVIEVLVGLNIHSLSLLSDAGHNLADVASLALSLIAFRLLKVPSNKKYTYGYKKTTILVALLNAAVLLLSIGAIGYEALHRMLAPEPIPGKTISLVAAIGILINALTALLFFRSKEKDLNIKSAFLHLMADAFVSAGLVAGGFLIYFTRLYWIDPVLSLIIAGIIVVSTWKLLSGSLRLSLDGVPEGIDLVTVRSSILNIPGVKGFHHIHIWAISTTENALTAHVVIGPDMKLDGIEKLKHVVKHELLHQNIQHATLEIEVESEPCEDADCE
jgi:cobalt-zinc-cadmium efflux system protein